MPQCAAPENICTNPAEGRRNVGCFANVQFANVLRRYLAWQWIKERRIIIKFVYTLAKL